MYIGTLNTIQSILNTKMSCVVHTSTYIHTYIQALVLYVVNVVQFFITKFGCLELMWSTLFEGHGVVVGYVHSPYSSSSTFMSYESNCKFVEVVM